MTCKPDELIRDPLFQLNAFLWMAQPLPRGADVEPLLYRRGFAVWAIAPLLTVPPDLRLRAQERSVVLQASVSPDVIVAKKAEGRFALVECKAASFGPASSTAEQARSLLIAGGPRCAEVLAIATSTLSESVLAFVVPEDQLEGFATTLETLGGELSNAQLSPGPPCLLGLSLLPKAIAVRPDDKAAAFFGLHRRPTPFIGIDAETCPRPLYFIPYDPDLDQSPAEKRHCKRVLFERLLASVVAATGRAIPPSDLVLERDRLLNDAMFGTYANWQNPGARRHMRRLCREFMDAVMSSLEQIVPGALRFEPPGEWHLLVGDDQEQGRVLNALTRFSCEDLAVGARVEPELFDEDD
ncbi:MAG: hypothetical protein FJ291_17495 [Planctomycetes bacterium]|nr:hypothetical protein [Planctomycetota bacterium]